MRTLIEEVVVDVDQTANQVVMLVHWSGRRHTELRVSKPKPANTTIGLPSRLWRL